MTRPFRFGVVAAHARSGEEWTAKARRVEELGYSTLLVPDRLGRLLSPMVALTAASAVTTTLRLGTFVLAAGLRKPAVVAHECATLDFLSGGRLEIGYGAGVSEEDALRAGLPFGTPADRVQQLAQTVHEVKLLVTEAATPQPGAPAMGGYLPSRQRPHPPILVAGGGQRMLSIAAQEAEIVSIGPGRDLDDDSLTTRLTWIREAAGDRLDDIELSVNLAAVAVDGILPPSVAGRLQGYFGTSLEALVAADSPFVLYGSVDQMVSKLQERRNRFGISYISVSDEVMEPFGPVVQALVGA